MKKGCRNFFVMVIMLLSACLYAFGQGQEVPVEMPVYAKEGSSGQPLSKRNNCLEVTRENGEAVFMATLADDERFILRHRHSVHRSLVEEFLAPGPGNTISVLEGRYQDYGAGLPQKAEPGQNIIFHGGKARLVLAPTYLPQIELRVGRIAEHTIILRDREIKLANLIEPGMVAIFRISEKVCPHEYP